MLILILKKIFSLKTKVFLKNEPVENDIAVQQVQMDRENDDKLGLNKSLFHQIQSNAVAAAKVYCYNLRKRN
jgi:hypothetical protein